ncbi:MAG TPA: hypothetical protein VG099_05935 [Gemmataceae bacterium]|jgi:hypothetical protein|nr:hypothetical protein [Gemmataceae bacterium]
MSTPNQFLRVVSLCGVCLVLLQQSVTALPFKLRQAYGIVVLVLAVVAVVLVLAILMPGTIGKLKRHVDLLVPLGLFTLADTVFGWLFLLPAIAAVMKPSQQVIIGVLTFSVSATLLVTILLQAAYGAWTTWLIVNTVCSGQTDPAGALRGLKRWFFRVFGLEFIGWGVLFAGLACAIALGTVALPLTLILVGVGSLVWNLATAALLPLALDERLRFWEAFRWGIAVSWRDKWRWGPILVAQMLLLGWITFFSVSYTVSQPGSVHTQNKTAFSVNGFWTGSYENECRWYGKLMDAVEAPPLQVLSTVLGLVFGVLAVAIKLRISEDVLRGSNPEPPAFE